MKKYFERKWNEARYEFWHALAKVMLKAEQISHRGLRSDKLFWICASGFDKCYARARDALDDLIGPSKREVTALEVV